MDLLARKTYYRYMKRLSRRFIWVEGEIKIITEENSEK
jgi:hypothetical protein